MPHCFILQTTAAEKETQSFAMLRPFLAGEISSALSRATHSALGSHSQKAELNKSFSSLSAKSLKTTTNCLANVQSPENSSRRTIKVKLS